MSLKQRDYCFAVVRRGFCRACKVSLTIFPNHMTAQYQQYLLSPVWQKRRTGCLIRAGKACEVCRKTDQLQAHHLTYERIYNEPLSDLMCLCKPCHEEAENWIAAGEISRNGNTAVLRALTVRKLTGCEQRYKQPGPLLDPLEVMTRKCQSYKLFRKFLKGHFKGAKRKGSKCLKAIHAWKKIHRPSQQQTERNSS